MFLINFTQKLLQEIKLVQFRIMSFLLSLTHVMVEKLLFLGQIFIIKILMDLHAMRLNHISVII